MGKGDEWLTKRELRVQLLGSVDIIPEEHFSEAELLVLLEHLDKQHIQ